jgi:hypothetical protein
LPHDWLTEFSALAGRVQDLFVQSLPASTAIAQLGDPHLSSSFLSFPTILPKNDIFSGGILATSLPRARINLQTHGALRAMCIVVPFSVRYFSPAVFFFPCHDRLPFHVITCVDIFGSGFQNSLLCCLLLRLILLPPGRATRFSVTGSFCLIYAAFFFCGSLTTHPARLS